MAHPHRFDEANLPARRWPPVLVWLLAWGLMLLLDDQLDLANKGLLLVLTAAISALWLAPLASLLTSALAVMVFNVVFVPPRGTLHIDLHQHALLLVSILSVSCIVALLMARLRQHAAESQAQALRSDQLRRLGDALRAADDPASQAPTLIEALSSIGGARISLLLAPAGRDALPKAATLLGSVSPDEEVGLRLCLHDGRPMGPGSGRHEEQPACYFALRGRSGNWGAAVVRLGPQFEASPHTLDHLQALCDQMGLALERVSALQAAASSREEAQALALRNTLLAAIAHDHRTPLATIVGAGSALHDQDARLSPAQRQKLAATIVDEATQLTRMTDNTLQLARLGAVGLALQRDWQSVEDLVGSVLHRVRQRDPSQRINVRVEPNLPLLRCDAVLMVQLLDNLVDNALKHGGSGAPVEVVARALGGALMVAVCDRGPGVPLALRERIFESFQRGPDWLTEAPHAHRGAGIGLALCRAIAHAHGGELRLRSRRRGGVSFELVMPVEAAPEPPVLAMGEGEGLA